MQVPVLVDHEVGGAAERQLLVGIQYALVADELHHQLCRRPDDTHALTTWS